MDGGAVGVIGHGEDIIGFAITGYPPGVLVSAAGAVAPDMLRVLIGIGIDHNVLQAQIFTGIHDADRYLATVGDENLSLQTVTHIILMVFFERQMNGY
jgi:hypothetical protein